MLIKKSK